MATDGRSQQVRPLLLGKTAVPPAGNDLVDRHRLVESLDAANTPLSVVVAPAGWGKTTLLAQWAKHSASKSTVAWLTLDESDNDPLRFWTYVVTALQRAGSSAGSSAAGALNIASLDPIDLAVPQLLNDLAEAQQPQALVLDDFHLITDSRITQAVEFLVTYLPPTTRLILGSRFDPPLPLALWRGRRMLTEIRAGQLRFQTEEAAELVGRTAELDLPPDQLDDLVQVTEGWAAGLQLSAMAVRSSPDPSRLVEAISGKHRHVVDFISSEVLGSLRESHREFLVRTSVLSALSAPLCDASLGIRRSEGILEELVALEPFLQRIGSTGWFRCHPVLRDALRREAGGAYADDQELVRTRASVWYLQAGEPESAIRLLIDGGKLTEAAGLLLEYENQFLEAGQIGIFLGLSQSLGPEVVASSPGLAVSMAWAAGVAGRPELIPQLLDRAEEALTGSEPSPEGWKSLAGSAAANRGMFGYQAGLGLQTAHDSAVRAVALESEPQLAGFSVARLALGLVRTGMDLPQQALAPLSEAWEHSDLAGMPAFARLPMAAALAMCLMSLDKAQEAATVLSRAAPIARRIEGALGQAASPAVGGLTVARGKFELNQGDAKRARSLLSQGVQQVRLAHQPSQTARALNLLASAELKLGDRRAASAALAEAREVAANDPVFPSVLTQLAAIEKQVGKLASSDAVSRGQMVEELTDRELAILRALQGPLSQREIGREMYLSINTVKGYTKSLYRKLGAASRAEAVEIARASQLL